MVAAPFISLSRGGFVVLGYILLVGIVWVLFKRNSLKGGKKVGLCIILLVGIGLSYYIGWEPLLKRLNSQNLWHETQIEAPNYEEKIEYIADLPAPPYDRMRS